MKNAKEITTKSGEKLVFGWAGNATQNSFFDQWKVGSERKDGKKREIAMADNSPSFPQLSMSVKSAKKRDAVEDEEKQANEEEAKNDK